GEISGRKLRLIGSVSWLRETAKALGVPPDSLIPAMVETAHHMHVEPGKPSVRNAGAVVAAITVGAKNALAGKAAALVTAPIHKAVLTESGFPFPGHTEFLAELTGVKRAVMMLAGPDLRVVPLTIHVPISEVPKHLDTDAIIETAE